PSRSSTDRRGQVAWARPWPCTARWGPCSSALGPARFGLQPPSPTCPAVGRRLGSSGRAGWRASGLEPSGGPGRAAASARAHRPSTGAPQPALRPSRAASSSCGCGRVSPEERNPEEARDDGRAVASGPMLKKLSHVNVFVEDQDRAKAFYTEKLGFEVRSDAT